MASKGRSIVSPLLKRGTVPRPARTPHRTFLTQARYHPRHFAHRNNATTLRPNRSFSTTPRFQYADEEDFFDPREVERESDEVDVCIVGGGGAQLAIANPKALTNALPRSGGPQRCHSIKANSQRSWQ
jgi:hypothetical protein